MDHMSLDNLSKADQSLLKQMALASINSAVLDGRPLLLAEYESSIDIDKVSFNGACFITLLKQGRLRGCIGTLEAYRPLYEDVIQNAYSAAMKDPRFPPVDAGELDQLELSISVLTEPQEIIMESELDLLNSVVPNVDGLIIQEGHHRATYLPSVWEQLPDPVEFINQLKCKAGLSQGYWSSTIKCFKYQVQVIK